MTQEIPYYLDLYPQFRGKLPTPATTINLKNASTNDVPAYINIARYGRMQTLEQPIEEVKANLRSAEVAAKKRLVMQSRIRSAARKLKISPDTQTRSASRTTNEPPAWLALYRRRFS